MEDKYLICFFFLMNLFIDFYFRLIFLVMNITSTNQQRTQRKITKKQIFSPSSSDRYVLVYFDENNQYKIFKSSDVISEKDGEVEIKNGESAALILTGKQYLKICSTSWKISLSFCFRYLY